jgi:hypothetical protein
MHVLTRLAYLCFVVCRRESVKVGWKFEILWCSGTTDLTGRSELGFDENVGKIITGVGCIVVNCSFEMRSNNCFVYWPCQHGTFSLRDRGDASAREEKGPVYILERMVS